MGASVVGGEGAKRSGHQLTGSSAVGSQGVFTGCEPLLAGEIDGVVELAPSLRGPIVASDHVALKRYILNSW